MSTMSEEIRTFLAQRCAERADAAQRVALGLVCGIDLEAVLAADAPARLRALRRIRRLAGRERLRGLSGHWSYDLNRHIALQQVAGRIIESLPLSPPDAVQPPQPLGLRRRAVD
jgi:hypothetical protein